MCLCHVLVIILPYSCAVVQPCFLKVFDCSRFCYNLCLNYLYMFLVCCVLPSYCTVLLPCFLKVFVHGFSAICACTSIFVNFSCVYECSCAFCILVCPYAAY
ncbi:hypothetical protein FOCC_FOCC007030 [Frankliniella occidentalis]|nr:hypothetical protein FOCC_FOCC007030 [Frankliniella occidentalis]